MSIQGSAMMYVTTTTLPSRLLARRDQRFDHFPGALEERRLDDHLVETGRVRAPEPGGVGVIRVAEDRNVREVVGDVVRVDPRNVGDHEVGWLDPVRRLEAMLRQKRLELPPDEEVDPAQEDRCHA